MYVHYGYQSSSDPNIADIGISTGQTHVNHGNVHACYTGIGVASVQQMTIIGSGSY